jgi:hypothetical protein
VLILAAGTFAAHGVALRDGLFLDDHLHAVRLKEGGWSLRALLDATTIVPADFMHAWWQDKPVQWQYARPFSMLLAKIVYHLSGESVKALHGLSVGLHLTGAVLVYFLCMGLTRSRFWSTVGGLLFVIHSHSVYAVGWLAAQNSVLQTVLTLAALLSYIRYSGLNIYSGNRDTAPRAEARGSLVWLGWTFVLWGLALFSRENALVFPAFALAFDLVFGGRSHVRRRIGVYAAMGAMAVGFAVWRLAVFYYPMPDFYVRRYDGPGYLLWWLAKLLHYVTGVVWLSPLMIGPSARFDPFSEVPGDCLLMIAILGIMATGYYLACRHARGHWIWPLWILLSLLPVVPVFAAPHSAYMPAVGYAVGMILGPALRREIRPMGIGRWSPAVAIWFLVATATYMPIYQAFWTSVKTAERVTIAQVAADPPSPEARDFFFINLPFVNIYARLHLGEQLASVPAWSGEPSEGDLRCHVLTYAPNVLRMEDECLLEQLDAYSFKLSIKGRGYFSGAMGRFLIEAMHSGGRMREGQHFPGEAGTPTNMAVQPFTVQILRADQDGVGELMFRFREPLASPRYCFYVTTNHQAAARVQFWRTRGGEPELPAAASPTSEDVERAAAELEAGRAGAADVLFAALESPESGVRDKAGMAFRRVATPIAAALASPVQATLQAAAWTAQDRRKLRSWWHTAVDDGVLRNLWVQRHDWEVCYHRRDRLFTVQGIASRIIQTDLYMTGPPYPGPR